ncbi:hypothetical protein ACFTXM_35010 [Streptomyces sp. NPDC056930]|uniref:aromatic-ring hydroxylase C-terminal domain-containing protein n=1 Tax=Streptomyces sp. NPDC056930 TaxID=3345967 RepID=UPI0036311784
MARERHPQELRGDEGRTARGVGRVGADSGRCRTGLLVRPDGRIAWASDHADPAALQAALTDEYTSMTR